VRPQQAQSACDGGLPGALVVNYWRTGLVIGLRPPPDSVGFSRGSIGVL